MDDEYWDRLTRVRDERARKSLISRLGLALWLLTEQKRRDEEAQD